MEKTCPSITALHHCGHQKMSRLQAITDARAHTYCDVKGGNNVERSSEDGAHSLDRGLIQAIVGRQHLPVEKSSFFFFYCTLQAPYTPPQTPLSYSPLTICTYAL